MRSIVRFVSAQMAVSFSVAALIVGVGMAPAQAYAAPSLRGTQWTIVSYPDAKGAQTPGTTGASSATLNFRLGGRTHGFTGCNSFNGSFRQSGSSLTLGLGPMTMKACVGPISVQEAAIMKYFPAVKSFSRSKNLILKDAKGKTLFVYKTTATGLPGTAWQATGVNNGKQAVVSDGSTAMITAIFSADGKLSGKGGCNSYAATYAVSGTSGIKISAPGATMMMCQPEFVMTTESQYFAALAKATTYVREGGKLTLRDATGAIQVTYVAQ